MRKRILTSLAAAAAVTASILITSPAASAADAPPALASANTAPQSAGATPNSQLPAAIQVDETQFAAVATLRGIGKQVYSCNASGAFAFQEPVAGLFSSRGIPTAIHGKGPFWAAFDGSHVDGSAPASAPSPDPTRNVPWLKLVGTPTPNTTGLFSNVVFIQRIDTRGGVAPAGPCTAPRTVAVDYTANYVFWAKK